MCVCVRAQVLWSREPLKAHRVPRIYRYIYLPAAFGVTTSSSSSWALKLFYISFFPFNIPVQAFLSLYLFLFVSPQILKKKKMKKEKEKEDEKKRVVEAWSSNLPRGRHRRRHTRKERNPALIEIVVKLLKKKRERERRWFQSEEADHANVPRALDTWRSSINRERERENME